MTDLSSRTIAWSVQSAARFVPGASCLTQALAAHVLLEQGAHPSTLHIGVSRERGRFEAHAWVEEAGSILIGELDQSFVSLPRID